MFFTILLTLAFAPDWTSLTQDQIDAIELGHQPFDGREQQVGHSDSLTFPKEEKVGETEEQVGAAPMCSKGPKNGWVWDGVKRNIDPNCEVLQAATHGCDRTWSQQQCAYTCGNCPQYEFTSKNNVCSTPGQVIRTKAECTKAIVAQGITIPRWWEGNMANTIPMGCSIQAGSNIAVWNTNTAPTVGDGRADLMSVCKVLKTIKITSCDDTIEKHNWKTLGKSYDVVCSVDCTTQRVWGCPADGRMTGDSSICNSASMVGIPKGSPFQLTIQLAGNKYRSCAGDNGYTSRTWTKAYTTAYTITPIANGQCEKIKVALLDGTFEAMRDVAGTATRTNQYNSNVRGAGWTNAAATADTWLAPVPVTPNPGVSWAGLADGTPPSPNGGVFAAALDMNNHGYSESFKADIPNLEVGKTYTISFYQANSGFARTGTSGSQVGDMAQWEVSFGTQKKYSTAMPYKGVGKQVWAKDSVSFVATATTETLLFKAWAKDGKDIYMAVDGIEISKSGSDKPCVTKSHCDLNKKVDLVLVLDGSGSVAPNEWDLTKVFTKDFADFFDLGTNQMRISLIQYSSTVKVERTLATGISNNAVDSAVDGMTQFRGLTNTPDGMKKGAQVFTDEGRAGVEQYMVVMTDGHANLGGSVSAAANAARSGRTIMSVGVGTGIQTSELLQIAGGDANLVFFVPDFTELAKKVAELSEGVCNIIKRHGNTAELSVGDVPTNQHRKPEPSLYFDALEDSSNSRFLVTKVVLSCVGLAYLCYELTKRTCLKSDYTTVKDATEV